MRIDYIGQSADCKTRYAVISSKSSEREKRDYIMKELDRQDGRTIHGFSDPDMQNDWIVVADREDYDWIKECYLNAKKSYITSKKERVS